MDVVEIVNGDGPVQDEALSDGSTLATMEMMMPTMTMAISMRVNPERPDAIGQEAGVPVSNSLQWASHAPPKVVVCGMHRMRLFFGEILFQLLFEFGKQVFLFLGLLFLNGLDFLVHL